MLFAQYIIFTLKSDLTGYAINVNFYLSIISTESCTHDSHQCATMDTAFLREHGVDICKMSVDM